MKREWPTKTLGEICGFVRGPFGGSLKKSVFVADGFAVYEQQHAIYDQFDDVRYFIDDAKFREMQRFELHPRDVIMSCSGTMGRVAIAPDNIRKGIINQALLKLTPSAAILPEFLKYWMDSSVFQDSLKGQSGGVAIQNVASVGILKRIHISFPPLAEQRRIVGILDEAFAGIATAKANAEKNLRNARALFEAAADSIFTELGSTVHGKPLAEFVDEISTGPFGSLLHKSDYEEGGIPLVNPINIQDNEIVPDARKAVGKQTASRLARYALRAGDVVTARRGEIGRCAAVSAEQAGWICGTGSFFIRPGANVDSQFLTHLLRSRPYRSQLERLSDRATMPSIGNDDLARLVVHIPGIQRQQGIESHLARLREDSQRLTRVYERKLAALDELKKSLLHQAFTGGL